MAPRRSVPPPSPARSTRSTRRDNDEDWESQSVMSNQSSFRPASRNLGNKDLSILGLKDTSVNIATAFHAARSMATPSTANSHPSRASSSAVNGARNPAARDPPSFQRSVSPAEQLANSARALSPVRYFLKPSDVTFESDGYNSFASLGQGNTSGDTSGGRSYDYAREEEYVQRARAQSRESRERRQNVKKGRDEDMPYRPGQDDFQPQSDDSGDEVGHGVVQGGALDGRAHTRGKRVEKGEGYLGTGLGIGPRRRRTRGGGEAPVEDGEMDDAASEMNNGSFLENTSAPPVSPRASRSHRSATPQQVLRNMINSTSSPAFQRKRRIPSDSRVVVTNLLHGVVLVLRFIVDLLSSIARGLLVRPLKSAFGSSKNFVTSARKNGWKWFLYVCAAGLGLQVLRRLVQTPAVHYPIIQDPPENMEQLITRLSALEHAITLLSESDKHLIDAEAEGKRYDTFVDTRMTELERTIKSEQRKLDTGTAGGDVKGLQSSYASLKAEIDSLATRMGTQESALKAVQGKLNRVDGMEKDVRLLTGRVKTVEQAVKDALDDGRLRAALDRILPSYLPVRYKNGRADIDPGFWKELKAVLVGRSEVDVLIRDAFASTVPHSRQTDSHAGERVNQAQIEVWGERVFDRKIEAGAYLGKEEFLRLLHSEMDQLRIQLEKTPKAPSAPPSVTIKSAKGDDLGAVLSELIDAALLKYSKDTLAKADYALFTAGGRIVPSITSDTLITRSPTKFGRYILGRKDIEGRSPATAIHSDTAVGECWPFKGSQGQLGVILSRRIIVTDLTVEHASKDVALDVSTAPHEVEVWGVVEGKENKLKVAQYHTERAIDSSADHLLLASFSYDPALTNHVQTFPVSPDLIELGVDIGIVILKVNSNWGGDFTCLYRMRVHGDAVSAE